MMPFELAQAYDDRFVRPLITMALPQHLVPDLNYERDKCHNTNYNINIDDIINKQHKRDYYHQRRKIEEVKKKIENLYDNEQITFNLEHIEDLEEYK